MAPTVNSPAGLTVDPALQQAWLTCVPDGELVGIAGATASTQGAVVVVSATPVGDTALAAATRRLAEVLGVRSVELVVASGSTLAGLVRDWAYQAGQGSGRGVHVKVRSDDDDGDGGGEGSGPIRVLVRAIDSSARELALRLASPVEPALPALRALLGGREVTVEDEESLPQ
jgi:hypothetical protein